MNRHAFACLSLVLVASAVPTGCIKKIQSNVPTFGQAVTLTATNVQGAFETVQTTYYNAQVLNYAANFKGGPLLDPSKLDQNWLPPEALAARVMILQGLQEYASDLSGLTASNSSVDPATTALGQSLQSLTATPPFQKIAADSQVPENLAVTAVNALANWLIDNELRKNLPGTIKKMDPTIQSICQLLVADIGSVDTDPNHPTRGSGLRQVLWVRYKDEIDTWSQYVLQNYMGSNVSPDAKLAAVKQLASMASQQKAADQTLAQVAVTISQMAQAHSQLTKAANANQPLIADVRNLLTEAERINTYYQSLQSSK